MDPRTDRAREWLAEAMEADLSDLADRLEEVRELTERLARAMAPIHRDLGPMLRTVSVSVHEHADTVRTGARREAARLRGEPAKAPLTIVNVEHQSRVLSIRNGEGA